MKKKNLKLALKTGVVLGLSHILNVQVLTWMKLGMTSLVFWINLTLLLIALAYVLKTLKGWGSFTIKSAMMVNLVLLAVAIWEYQIYMQGYIHFIDPEWVEKVVKIRAGTRTGDELETFRETMHGKYAPSYYFTIRFMISLCWNLLFSFLVTLVGKNLTKA